MLSQNESRDCFIFGVRGANLPAVDLACICFQHTVESFVTLNLPVESKSQFFAIKTRFLRWALGPTKLSSNIYLKRNCM